MAPFGSGDLPKNCCNVLNASLVKYIGNMVVHHGQSA
jgi:hypothetical protein